MCIYRMKQKANGFTLIELIVVFTFSVTLALISITGFTRLSELRKFDNAVQNVVTLFYKAKSRAQTQVKPDTIPSCQVNTLSGYEVSICGLTGSPCTGVGRYELHIICGTTRTFLEAGQLPSGMTFQSGSIVQFPFSVLSGASGTGSVIVDGYGKTATIQISSVGNIVIQ